MFIIQLFPACSNIFVILLFQCNCHSLFQNRQIDYSKGSRYSVISPHKMELFHYSNKIFHYSYCISLLLISSPSPVIHRFSLSSSYQIFFRSKTSQDHGSRTIYTHETEHCVKLCPSLSYCCCCCCCLWEIYKSFGFTESCSTDWLVNIT